MKIYRYKIIALSIFLTIHSHQYISGQSEKIIPKDSAEVQQIDIVDVFQRLFTRQLRKDSSTLKGNGPFVSIIPAIGYSMHTGFTGNIAASTTFYTGDERRRISRTKIDGNYSQFHHYWFTAFIDVFLEKHKLHLFGDTRYYKFPTQTYGLGPNSPLSNPLKIDYSYLRFYQVVFREMASNLFFGMGYNLDHH
jgi:hypothetical protein